MKKIFVTGSSGLLGSNIINIASENFDSYGSYYKNKVSFSNCKCELTKIDLTNKNQIKILTNLKPDLIIHCAAFVNVDGCEKDPKKAYSNNVFATDNIVKICEKTNSFLIHISTDAVFDGEKGNYSENDKVNPINVYGETKLKAEELIKKSDIDFSIVRTNIYGWNKINKFSMAEWMINNLKKGEKLNAFGDVFFTPILVNNLAQALFEIYEKKLTGILHIAGSERLSKFEFAQKLAEVYDFDNSIINKISVDDLDLPAKRGKDISLNTSKAQSLLKTELLDAKQGLLEMKRLKEEGFVKDLKGL